jgi:hypothetical protein
MTDTQRNAIINEVGRPRSFGYLHLLLAAIAGTVICAVVMVLMPQAGSLSDGAFEECVLREMRGQPSTAAQVTEPLCYRRHPECVSQNMLCEKFKSLGYMETVHYQTHQQYMAARKERTREQCDALLEALGEAARPWWRRGLIEHIDQNGVYVALAAGFGFLAVFCFWPRT